VNFIIEPDVAFYKARMLSSFYETFLKNDENILTSNNGFFLSKNIILEKMPARVFKILETFDYQPKKIKNQFKILNINVLNVVQRNFPFSTQQVRTALNLKEGGELFLICTLVNERKVVWLAEKY
jgi:THUMP domain-like